MPFSQAHYVLQFGGDLAPDEIFSNNIRLATIGSGFTPLTVGQEAGVLTAIKTYLTAWWGTANSGWSTRAKLRYIKFNYVGVDGLYASSTGTNVQNYDTPAYVTGAGTSAVPNSTAMVVSWTTAALRGRASRGRIFIPAPGCAVDPSTGRWSSANMNSAAAAAKVFMNALRTNADLAGAGIEPVVASKVGSGTTRLITGVRVGDVPDTMRSRRNAQREAYSTLAL